MRPNRQVGAVLQAIARIRLLCVKWPWALSKMAPNTEEDAIYAD